MKESLFVMPVSTILFRQIANRFTTELKRCAIKLKDSFNSCLIKNHLINLSVG